MSQQGTEEELGEELAEEVAAHAAQPGEAPLEGLDPVDEGDEGDDLDGDPEAPRDALEDEDEAGSAERAEAEEDAPEPDDADEDPSVPGREVTDGELERELSALLLASPDPLSTPRLRKLLGVGRARVEAALLALGERLRTAELPWELRPISGGWQLYTTPDMVDTVSLLAKVKKEERVSPAALETLAVVAYRQPVTKAEIEAIRGVQVGPVLRTLIDRGLLKIAGRAEVPGSPLLYGTTRKFLDAFGLMQIDDLPRDAELIKD